MNKYPKRPWRGSLPCVVCWKVAVLLHLLCLLGGVRCWGERIQIEGSYEKQRFDKASGMWRGDLKAGFSVIMSGATWGVFATNLANRAEWEVVVYDGHDTYSLSPGTNVRWRDNPLGQAGMFGSVSPGANYPGLVQTGVEGFVPWMVFVLSPEDLKPGFDAPLPWRLPRRYLSAYGYEWRIDASPSGRFIAACEWVRNPQLDAKTLDAEFLRPQFDYPTRAAYYREQLQLLQDRKAIRAGFVAASYVCEQWHETNGMRVPASGVLTRYYPENDGGFFALFRTTFKVSEIKFHRGEPVEPPARGAAALIQDYRYRKAGPDRAFRFAEYVLRPEHAWKEGSDPALRELAERRLAELGRYDDFGWRGWWYDLSPGRKRSILWLALIAAQVPVLMILFRAWRRRSRTRKT